MALLFFGQAREIVGVEEGEWSVLLKGKEDFPKSVKELRAELLTAFPALGELSSLAIAVNADYAEEDTPLESTDEIAIIPPVSGG